MNGFMLCSLYERVPLELQLCLICLGEADDSLYCVVIVFLLSLLRFCIARSQIADVFESLTGALEGWCVLYLKDYILIVEILRTEQKMCG